MYKNLVELAKECPGLQVTITLGELIEANRSLIVEVKRELEQEIADSKAETYILAAKRLWRYWECLLQLFGGGRK